MNNNYQTTTQTGFEAAWMLVLNCSALAATAVVVWSIYSLVTKSSEIAKLLDGSFLT